LSPAALLLAAALAAPARAATVKLFAFDAEGRALDLPGLLARLGRADDKLPRDPAKAPLWAVPVDGKSEPVRAALAQIGGGKLLTATWPGGPAALRLVWPVEKDGYSAVAADNGGHGYADGAFVFLEEEIALTEYRRLKESAQRQAADGPAPSAKALKLDEAAKLAIAYAQKQRGPGARAEFFGKALHAVALASETALFERGRGRAHERAFSKTARFGVTLDDGVLKRLDDLDWIADSVAGAGNNWVRLVFRPNPADFAYASPGSFAEYDAVVKALKRRKLKILGGVLDTAQWPRTLTPEIYAGRVKNLAEHYKGQVDGWEVGSEINGDWLGGAKAPLAADDVFKIYRAGAAAARAADRDAEVDVTLYWWEETAPDREHSLSGWLANYGPKGFARDVDVVGLDVFPEDAPAGLALERAFDELAAGAPETRLLLSSYGYVEKDKVLGYWWLSPDDPDGPDGARKDLVLLYTAGSCAMPRSLCGGFWWQTLDQMLPPGRKKPADLFKVYAHALHEAGR